MALIIPLHIQFKLWLQTKSDPNYKIIAEYRRARYDYAIENDLECGVMLMGSEVKSLRENLATLLKAMRLLSKASCGWSIPILLPMGKPKLGGMKKNAVGNF